jgi:hypothetical protein
MGSLIENSSSSNLQTTAAVTIAVVASCVPALQSVLLGQLLTEGKIGATTLGQAATAEGLGMALATAVASATLPPRRLRLSAIIAILAVLTANALTTALAAPWIVAARCLRVDDLHRHANGVRAQTLQRVPCARQRIGYRAAVDRFSDVTPLQISASLAGVAAS